MKHTNGEDLWQGECECLEEGIFSPHKNLGVIVDHGVGKLMSDLYGTMGSVSRCQTVKGTMGSVSRCQTVNGTMGSVSRCQTVNGTMGSVSRCQTEGYHGVSK